VFGPVAVMTATGPLVWLEILPLVEPHPGPRVAGLLTTWPENWVGRISRSRLTGLAPVRDYF